MTAYINHTRDDDNCSRLIIVLTLVNSIFHFCIPVVTLKLHTIKRNLKQTIKLNFALIQECIRVIIALINRQLNSHVDTES